MPEKYQRELQEILDSMNFSPSVKSSIGSDSEERFSKNVTNPFHGLLTGWRQRITPGKIMISAISLLLIWMLLNATTSFDLSPMVWLAITLFIVAYISVFIRQRNTYQKKWRGRVIDDPKPSFYDRIRRFYNR